MGMRIVAGPASQLLATRTASLLGCEVDLTEYRVFPDGEVYCRVTGEVRGQDIAIIQSTPTARDYLYLLELIDACDEAKSLAIIMPYMGYARQDKRFQPGEPISARALAKAVHADKVFTVNVHDRSVLSYFPCEAADLSAAGVLGNYIENMSLHEPVILAPDDGALPLVKATASRFHMPFDYLDKTRLSGDEVRIAPKRLEVEGRDVVLLDDIVSTGGTIAEAVRLLRQGGAREVHVACVHAVLARNALLRMHGAGMRSLLSTDTLERATSRVSVAPVIAEALR